MEHLRHVGSYADAHHLFRLLGAALPQRGAVQPAAHEHPPAAERGEGLLGDHADAELGGGFGELGAVPAFSDVVLRKTSPERERGEKTQSSAQRAEGSAGHRLSRRSACLHTHARSRASESAAQRSVERTSSA